MPSLTIEAGLSALTPRPPTRTRQRRQAWALALCTLAVLGAARWSGGRRAAAPPLTEQLVRGDWQLVSVNGDPVGPNVESVIVSQELRLRDGLVDGVTRIRSDTPAAASAMPFPDQTVSNIKLPIGMGELVARWHGAYRIAGGSRLEMRIGSATYWITVEANSRARMLTLDHDAILTYRGAARYRALPAGGDLTRPLRADRM